MELFLTWNSFLLHMHVMVRLFLCHGKAMSAFEIDAYMTWERFSCRIFPTNFVRKTESSLRYLRGPGCYEICRAIGIKTGYVSSSKIQTGKIAAENSGSRAAYNSRRKMPGPFFFRQCTSPGRDLQNDLKVDMVTSPRSCRKYTSKKGSNIGYTPS